MHVQSRTACRRCAVCSQPELLLRDREDNVLQPESFCWSKFGTEAGERAESIIARKEQERYMNGGLFLWGIGTSIWPSLRALLTVTKTPRILFTPMLSPAAKVDVYPESVAIWSAAMGMDGSEFEIPKHSTVSSRYSSRQRRRHYALVCSSDNELCDNSDRGALLYRSELRNLLNNTVIGASQVTAVVRRIARSSRAERPHRVAFAATLVHPYLIQLLEPECLPPQVALSV